MILALAIFFSSGDSQRTSEGVPRRKRHVVPVRIVKEPRN